jgi:hypothetical protein
METEFIMINDTYLDFIRDRINEIRSAIFFNLSNAAFKLPTTIISVLKADKHGHIWFLLPFPEVRLEEEDKIFPARLDFYRKGKAFSLKVSGSANVILSEEFEEFQEEFPYFKNEMSYNRLMLIKLKVGFVEYSERVIRAKGWIENKLLQFLNWLHLFSTKTLIRVDRPIFQESLKYTEWKF